MFVVAQNVTLSERAPVVMNPADSAIAGPTTLLQYPVKNKKEHSFKIYQK
jgi:hypothetical protein